jgi:hypothetical protein
MAKIILMKGDTILCETWLSKGRLTIGRRPHNDIVIDDLAISGEHAVIVSAHGDSYLEDLNSTNGTKINGQPVKTHFLQDGDVIDLAQYRIAYMVQPEDGQKTDKPDQYSLAEIDAATRRSLAFIKVLNGANAGKISFLKRPLTTIGRIGTQVAVIVWKAENYYLAHIEGDAYPLVNGCPIGPDGHLMNNGDSIDLSGTVMEFSVAAG